MKSPVRLAALLILILLFAVNCYRAATQSIVHDEALTWQFYLFGPISNIFELYDANNHFLATLLFRLSVGLFGASEFSLRLPVLLAGALYFWSAFRLSLLVFGERPMALLSVLLLSLNPIVLDFLVAARGYGVALALFLYGVWQATVYLTGKPEQRRTRTSGATLYRTAAGLSLAVTANLTFLFPVLIFSALFCWAVRATAPRTTEAHLPPPGSGRARKKKKAEAAARRRSAAPTGFPEILRFSSLVTAIALVFFLAAPIQKARSGDFYAGAATIGESLRSLFEISFAHNDGIAHVLRGSPICTSGFLFLQVMIPLAILCLLGIGLRYLAGGLKAGSSPDGVRWLLASTSLTVGGSALLLVLSH